MGFVNSILELLKDPRAAIAGWIAMGVAPTLGFIFLIVFIETGVVFFPFLTILSIAIGIIGGWAIAYLTGIMIPADYVDGLLMDFKPYSIVYSLIKTAVFAYIITSISAFYGYYAKGNSLEVGAASTRAVVASSVVIMIFNLILTQVLLI